MARRSPWLVLALLAGCGGLRAGPGHALPPDPAIALVERLPAGLARCVAARVDRVPTARRRAFGEVSLAGSLAFEPGAPIAAAAVAAEREGRLAPFVALFRTTAPPGAVRSFFESSAGAHLSFDDELLCEEEGLCRAVAIDFVEPTLLRIRHGTFAEARSRDALRSAPSGRARTNRCAALLLAHPGAVEVAAWAADPAAPGSRISSALEGEWTVHAWRGGLHVTRVERYGDPRFAATSAQLESALPPEPGWIVAADPEIRVAVGSELRFEAELTFRDLALRAQDQERLRRAMAAEMAFAWRLVPVEGIDVRRYEVVDRQVYVRRERLREASGPDAVALARELVALVDRALEVHPEQERLAEVRFEVLLDVLSDARAAANAAEAALGMHPDDRSIWLARRREALVRFDADAAAAALEDAGVADEGRGREVAAVLRALLGAASSAADGRTRMPYPVAEAALALAERLEDASEPARLAAPLLIEWHALPETALALFELRGLAERSDRLVAIVRGAPSPGAEPEHPFVELARSEGRERRVAVVATDGRAGLRAFGRALPRATGQGRATLTFSVVGEPGARRIDAPLVALSGHATPRGFRVEAARGPTSDWPRVSRLLAAPLARMHPFHRPTPAFAVEPLGREERRVLLERLRASGQIECADAGHGLACRSSLAGTALRRAWLGAVGPLLGP